VDFLKIRDEEIRMKKSRFSEHQILQILKQAQTGTPVPCREHGMTSATFYNSPSPTNPASGREQRFVGVVQQNIKEIQAVARY
jgi:hypothetical protein